jgi:SAM-dependent methyltransferase
MMKPLALLLFARAGVIFGRPAASACPPSCANNELLALLDQYCSDKGTFWQSKHHYGTAYHALFGSIRQAVSSILEIGIGEDTAPSVQAWATYFPNAHVYPVDIKTRKEVAERARPGGATDKLVKHQAQFGCEYNRSMWDNPRVHLTLETDAADTEQLKRVPLPAQLDIILDDGSHKYLDQQRTLHVLWPRLRPGGFYIIEDMLVGALPWSKDHANQVPTQNSDCGPECFFPQRLAEHPFLFDRFGHLKGTHVPSVPLEPRTKALLRAHDWFWVVTGVHQGGGLDCSLIIRKSGPPIGPGPLLSAPAAAMPAAPTGGASTRSCGTGCVDANVLREAHKALLAAQELQAKLQARQEELAARLLQTEAGGSGVLPSAPACGTSTGLLLVVLAVSVGANAVQWRQRRQPSATLSSASRGR